MAIGNRTFRTFTFVPLLLASLAAASERPGFDGYWEREDDEADYGAYLKVQGDSGYYCVLDGKSSFRFKLAEGYITTPMNGKNAIASTSPTTLRISGSEKGVPYHSDFRSMTAAEYPRACVEEEAEWYGPTALAGQGSGRMGSSPEGGTVGGMKNFTQGGFKGGGTVLPARGRWMDLLGRAR